MLELTVFPNFKHCCCCVPLRGSTIGIAIIYTLLCPLLLVVYGVPLAQGTSMEESTRYFFYLFFLSLVAQLASGLVLIYGAIKGNTLLCFPWVLVSFCQGAALVLLAMVCTFSYIYQVTRGDIYDDPEESTMYMIYAIYGLVLYFAAAVVNSYRKLLIEEERSAEARSGSDITESQPLNAI